jgi:hypothetical protein
MWVACAQSKPAESSAESQPAERPEVSVDVMHIVVAKSLEKLKQVTTQEIEECVAKLEAACEARKEAEMRAQEECEARRKAEKLAASLQKQVECVMCFTNERSVMFQPCFHFISCLVCQHKVSKCPICRTAIAGRLVAALV